jgi:acyl carrier protein
VIGRRNISLPSGPAICYREARALFTEPFLPPSALSEQRVKEIIASVYMRAPREHELTWRDIGGDDPLYSIEEGEESLGLDSLDAVEIATELEEEFDVVLPAEIDPTELRTVRQVMLLLERHLAEQRGPE